MEAVATLLDYNTMLEQQVLACIIAHAHSFSAVQGMLTPACFADATHTQLYDAVVRVWQQGHMVDAYTVIHQLQTDGVKQMDGQATMVYITGMCMQQSSPAMLPQWCHILRALAARRLMMQLTSTPFTGTDVVGEAARLQDQLRDVLEIHDVNEWIDATTATRQLQQHVANAMDGTVKYISTSFPSLDDMNGGFRPGQLVVIGARPSVGKSALAGGMALHAAIKGAAVGMISLEMPVPELMGRIASIHTDIPYAQLDRKPTPAAMQLINDNGKELSNLPLYFSDNARATIHDISARAQQLKETHGLDMLIVDYLQLIEENPMHKQRNREQNISAISRGLKLIAMQLQIPVIALSQLNRESEHRANKRPTLADLRESGAIEQDADIVMLLHRDWKAGILTDEQGRSTEDQAQLLICKWRNGSTHHINLHFDAVTMCFKEEGITN